MDKYNKIDLYLITQCKEDELEENVKELFKQYIPRMDMNVCNEETGK